MRVKNLRLIVLSFILYALLVILLSGGHIAVRLYNILFFPIYTLGEICFYLLPLEIIILACLCIYQFIIKDYEKYNRAIQILTILNCIGIADLKIEQLIYITPALSIKDFLTIDLYTLGIILITCVSFVIYNKKDARYYFWIIVPIAMLTLYNIFVYGG